MRLETDRHVKKNLLGTGSAADFLPEKISYPALCAAAEHCRGCELYAHAKQTVFGEGCIEASFMLIGEQPGDQEDLQGYPFVGPAGALLNKALAEAGIKRGDVYITNAVKHFRFEQHGKRRVHKTPTARNIKACRPWLDAEIEVVKPAALLCLGATAAKAIIGPKFSLTKSRGQWLPYKGNVKVMATFHPSAALRAPDPATRAKYYRDIVTDMEALVKIIRTVI